MKRVIASCAKQVQMKSDALIHLWMCRWRLMSREEQEEEISKYLLIRHSPEFRLRK
jgi:hypothetical protein